MGSNKLGQLGIDSEQIEQKFTPTLVEALMNFRPIQISCGDFHTVVCTQSGDVFSWGLNESG